MIPQYLNSLLRLVVAKWTFAAVWFHAAELLGLIKSIIVKVKSFIITSPIIYLPAITEFSFFWGGGTLIYIY